MKSFLSGNPAISLHLIDDLRINRREGGGIASSYGGVSSSEVVLDDCNFHESVNLESFDINRSLDLIPPEGETALMNYRWVIDARTVLEQMILAPYVQRLGLLAPFSCV